MIRCLKATWFCPTVHSNDGRHGNLLLPRPKSGGRSSIGAIGGATGGAAGAAAANVATNAVSGKAAREGTDSERRGESPSKHKFNGEFNLHQMY